jgi:hypothetical protein
VLDWSPRLNAYSFVNTLALSPDGRTLYFAGFFHSVGGRARNNVAAVDSTSGAVTHWNPRMSGIPNTVYALCASRDGRTVFVGGGFDRIGGKPRAQIAQLDARTGVATTWNPRTDGANDPGSDVDYVMTLALGVDGSTLYAGGYFESIGGMRRDHLAALDVSSGRTTPWNPSLVGDNVGAIVPGPDGKTVYIAGDFDNVGGQPRHGLAAVDSSSARATSWDPRPNDGVAALALGRDGRVIYAGGDFTSVGGEVRAGVAAFTADGRTLLPWDPHVVFASNEWGADSLALSRDGTTLYVGGQFERVGGRQHRNLAAIDIATAKPRGWNIGVRGPVDVLKLSEDGRTLYVGGNFSRIGRKIRPRLAAVDVRKRVVLDWNPVPHQSVIAIGVEGRTVFAAGGFGRIGRATRRGIAALDAGTGLASGWDATSDRSVRAIAIDGHTMYVSGAFTSIGGKLRGGLAQLDAATASATAWNPRTNDSVQALALSRDGTSVFVAGWFSRIAGVRRPGIAAIDAKRGTPLVWVPRVARTYYSAVEVSPDDSTLYVGGGGGLLVFR